jgi:hypothetical protein
VTCLQTYLTRELFHPALLGVATCDRANHADGSLDFHDPFWRVPDE